MKTATISGPQKLSIVGQPFEFAYSMKVYALKKQFPDTTKEEIKNLALQSIKRGTR